MQHIDTIVIGGGQAGLAMSRCLSGEGVEHVVLERGRIGERWRSERWDSLRLLTPRWLSRLSGWSDSTTDPDGFMGRGEVIAYLERYAASFPSPVHAGVTVRSVESHGRDYRVVTDEETWTARHVVIATGESQDAQVPSFARDLSADYHQVVPTRYRHPYELPDGGVLVVGASATGVQLAAEIHATGRPVSLAVGRHTRLPRTYRGRDILAWFQALGILDESARTVRNLAVSRNQPSMQLTGSFDHRPLDLGILHAQGVRLLGRARGVERGRRVFFDDDLVERMAASDVKLARLRLRIDRWIREKGLDAEAGPEEPFEPVPLVDAPTALDLRASGIRSVLWATGFRRSYPWLRVPVLDARGEIVHTEGVTSSPGLYVLGLNFMRTRSSSFIAGVGRDAAALTRHLVEARSGRARSAAARAVA